MLEVATLLILSFIVNAVFWWAVKYAPAPYDPETEE